MQTKQDAQAAGTFTTLHSSRAANVIYITLTQLSPVVSLSFAFSLLPNEASLSCMNLLHREQALSTVTLLSPFSAFVFVYSISLYSPLPALCTCTTLVSPSGPHWGLPLSPADNYCHLHIARCDKHSALPVARRRTTMPAQAASELVGARYGRKQAGQTDLRQNTRA